MAIKPLTRHRWLPVAAGILAVLGWPLWLMSTRTSSSLSQEVRQLEELNQFLLTDVRDFRVRLEKSAVQAAKHSASQVEAEEAARLNRRQERIISHLKKENGYLKTKVEKLSVSFRRRIRDIVDAKSTFEQTVEDANRELGRAGGSVPLGTLSLSRSGAIFDNLAPASSEPAAPHGRIVSVDDQDEFVVINLGKKSGLQTGAELFALQGKAEIAKLQVIEVRDSMAACDIRYLSAGGKLRSGDEVVPASG